MYRILRQKFRLLIGLVAVLGLLGLVGCTSQPQEKSPASSEPAKTNPAPEGKAEPGATAKTDFSGTTLRFFSGAPGGSWYPLSVAITQAFERDIPGLKTAMVTGGAGAGPIVLTEGNAEAGLAVGGTLVDAIQGKPPFFDKAYPDLQNVANLYNHVFQIAVLKDSKIQSIADLKGKKFSSGPKGQYSGVWFKELARMHGVDPGKELNEEGLAFQDAVEAVKNGQLDVFAGAFPMPLAVMTDLAAARDIRLLQLDDAKWEEFTKTVNGFWQVTIPRERITYKGDFGDLKTVGTPLSIMVPTKADADLVYFMTKTIVNNLSEFAKVAGPIKDLEPKDLAKELLGVSFHPGANKYYKEIGLK